MRHVNVALFVPHLGCPHTCVFCDQRAISGRAAPITREEIVRACRIAAACPHDRENSEIAFFGGSFTAVDRAVTDLCLDAAAPFLGRDFGGIRVSTRPDAVDDETLSYLKRKGVTAVELGAQSMDDGVLRRNARGHTAAQTEEALRRIRAHGLSPGLQMMTGMYGSDPQKDLATARAFVRLRPDTVRVYPTVVLRNTALADLYRAGAYTPPSLEETVDLCAALLDLFEDAGIRVIRLGLHAGGDVEENRLAGPYHPALRELCESRRCRAAAERALADVPPGPAVLSVPRGRASVAAGHGGCNKTYFAEKGYRLRILERAEPGTARDVRVLRTDNG